MKANVGSVDRVIRIVLSIMAAVGGYKIGGTLGVLLYVVAGLALITGVSARCVVYRALGICSK